MVEKSGIITAHTEVTMPQFKKSERGQVLVLLVLGMVALFGFAALAIDGSMVYSDRRYDQSAADSASLAGGGAAARLLENNHVYYENFTCSNPSVSSAKVAAFNAAKTRAATNFITNLDNNISDHQGIVTTCEDNKDMGAYKDKYIDIHVAITSETQTAFAQLVFGGKLKNQVDAVVRVRPRSTDVFGYAIVSTSNSCSNGDNGGGVWFDGTMDTHVYSGGIFSNSCIGQNGASGSVAVVPPEVGVVARQPSSVNDFTPAPTITSSTLPPFEFAKPSCAGLTNWGDHTGGGDLQPGYYGRIRLTNGDIVNLAPGPYCISGGISANGGEINGVDVSFYMTGGDFDMGAQVKATLRAPQADPIPAGTVKGMLIRLSDNLANAVYLRGSSDSSFLGTVYAPKGDIEVGGNSSNLSMVSCQLIGNQVRIHGDVTLKINFSTAQNDSHPSSIDLLH